jgi:lysophospholipase L1-like esterase
MNIPHWLATLILGPLLLYQGRRVRRTVPLLPEPPGERTGVTGDGPRLRLLVTGDSAAAGVGATHQDEALLGQLVANLAGRFTVDFTLLAKTGATTASTHRALEKLQGQSFHVAVTSLGVNDVTTGLGLSAWRKQQVALRRHLRHELGVKLLILTGLPPVHGFPALPQPLRGYLGRRATHFDHLLQQDVAPEPDSHYLSLRFSDDVSLLAADGFHPGPGIYREWARRAADRIGDLPGS